MHLRAGLHVDAAWFPVVLDLEVGLVVATFTGVLGRIVFRYAVCVFGD